MNDREKNAGSQRLFFNEHQWATIEAAMARIIPSDDTPGAREADAIAFLDRYLSGLDYIYAKADGSGFQVLKGKKATSWQERIEILRQRYREGVQEIDRQSNIIFHKEFYLLTAGQQDNVLSRIEKPDAERNADHELDGFTPTAAMQQYETETDLDFFQMLVLHTRQGFYADPIYGGNKDRVGWQVIGFTGPQSLADAFSGAYNTLAFFSNVGSNSSIGNAGSATKEGGKHEAV
ncbi:MAG: gluconate 2-dehydrogenase subunit 3 family protein [Ktedonobacteraceae bacterium]